MRAKAFNRKTNSYETLRFIGGRVYNENGDLIQTREDEKMKIRSHRDFPLNDIKKRVYAIYPIKGIVVVDGFKRFSLKSLTKIDLNIRLGFPPDLFIAINQAQKTGDYNYYDYWSDLKDFHGCCYDLTN